MIKVEELNSFREQYDSKVGRLCDDYESALFELSQSEYEIKRLQNELTKQRERLDFFNEQLGIQERLTEYHMNKNK